MAKLVVNNGHKLLRMEKEHLYTVENAVVAIRLFHHCSPIVLVLAQRKEKKHTHVKDLTPPTTKKRGKKYGKVGGRSCLQIYQPFHVQSERLMWSL